MSSRTHYFSVSLGMPGYMPTAHFVAKARYATELAQAMEDAIGPHGPTPYRTLLSMARRIMHDAHGKLGDQLDLNDGTGERLTIEPISKAEYNRGRLAEEYRGIVIIERNGDPFESGFVGCQYADPWERYPVYRGDIGAKPRGWWRSYCRQNNLLLREPR